MSDVALAPLSTLWSARTLRVVPPVPDLEAIAAAARALGQAAGRAEAEGELATLSDALAAAVAALDAARKIDPVELQPLFVDLVARIAGAVVDGELSQSPEAVERLVTAALAEIDVDGTTVIFTSAEDAALLRHPRAGGDDGQVRGDDDTPRIVADPDLAPGNIRVETPAHVISASLSARLAAIVGGL